MSTSPSALLQPPPNTQLVVRRMATSTAPAAAEAVIIVKSQFLRTIPAELRNKIYEMSLVAEDHLEIDKDNPTLSAQPPLLRVCRQIRSEAIGVFYNRNTFSNKIDLFNSNVLHQWLPIPVSHHYEPTVHLLLGDYGYDSLLDHQLDELSHNVMKWMERRYKQEIRMAPSMTDDHGDPWYPIQRLFNMGRILHEREKDWEVVEPVFRMAVEAICWTG